MTVARPAPIDVVVDTSAVMAMILDEPSASTILATLDAARGAVMSAGTLTELLDVPILCTGDDFARTDLATVPSAR
jgi:uncharacterized protein with PIN domain